MMGGSQPLSLILNPSSTMTQCLVYDNTTKESESFFTLTAAKKWMRDRQKQGHEVEGRRYKVYSNGDTVNCGKIQLTGNNKSYIANSKQTKPGY